MLNRRHEDDNPNSAILNCENHTVGDMVAASPHVGDGCCFVAQMLIVMAVLGACWTTISSLSVN